MRLSSDPVPANPRRWLALIFISLAQLMVALDATVVNIALPSAQHDLGFSDGNRQWVITGYTLAFGGLLLFGGRLADIAGRKRIFLVGLLGFAVASAVGGVAADTGTLLTARALQGAFAALLAPAALALLSVTFTEAKERARAYAVFGAIAAAGGGVGLILGGVLTEYLDWRWALFINVPFALVATIGAIPTIHDTTGVRRRERLDVPGVMLATAGLVALVYGFTRAESDGWTAGWTLGSFLASAVLLLAFVLVEARVPNPLLPLRVVTERTRGGVYASIGLSMVGMFGLFLFLTYYLQVVQAWSPVRTGLGFLPLIIAMILGPTLIGARLSHRVRPGVLLAGSFLTAAIGLLLLTQMTVDSSYLALILPSQVLLGLGTGTAFLPAMSLATHGLRRHEAGIASAIINTSQQVGASIGTALLNTVAAGATATWLLEHAGTANQAIVHGYATAVWWAVGFLVVAAFLAITLVRVPQPDGTGTADEPNDGPAGDATPLLVH
ncbi:drug resistance transporter, EmrB/QacA subfamily [Asanoa hainanensis]|uniref:Drug resistance transporter, EmrB/QacA subfamily n=1 Tax=Asanoa hainanensis TaxID=560556 RepID=A0A239PEH7_9ACTN|nr:MFS transporter [Asanoa hainanensis]SNT65486.1 drug resistance transporter, EmrB/QacA subfamily [Asanoa hainanensis]